MTRHARRQPVDLIDGPTPEQRRHGDYRVIPMGVVEGGGKATHKAHRNMSATPWASAYNAKTPKLTTRQYDAAERISELARRVEEFRTARRDTLDDTPRGHDNLSPEAMAKLIDAKTDWANLRGSIDPARWLIIRKIVCNEEPIGDMRSKYRRYSYLCEGLDMAADFWKMPGEHKTLG